MQILAMHGVLGFGNEGWLTSGRVRDSIDGALHALQRLSPSPESRCDRADDSDLFQSVAQQQMLLGRADDANESFARCTKALADSPRAVRQSRSLLISSLQSLHRHHLRPAWTGLQHVLDAKQAPLPVSVQAHGALAALYFGLGMRRPAAAAVDRGIELLEAAADEHAVPLAVLRAMKVEFVALDLLRQHEKLHDLVSWPRHEEVAGNRVALSDARAMIDNCRAQVAGLSFVQARLEFLDALICVAYGRSAPLSLPMDHVHWLQSQGLHAHAHAARHEFALACIASQSGEQLRQVMQFYAAADRRNIDLRHNVEHEYCMAKLGEFSSRDDVYIAHYREYASKSLVHMRQTCAYITVPSVVRQAASEIPRDDIASRLTGKYRRAYQFIHSNLHREDLSIRQVADAVGVTERSLQLAFRAALGLSPSEVIRQCRMDRIRDELKSGAVSHGTTTLDIGRRWGLRSRSAMSQAFKSLFGELPSEAAAGVARASTFGPAPGSAAAH
jgi:AraC-like DNA-binding protein